MKSQTQKQKIKNLEKPRSLKDFLECAGILMLVDVCCVIFYPFRWVYVILLYMVQKAYLRKDVKYDWFYALDIVIAKIAVVLLLIAVQDVSGGTLITVGGIQFLMISMVVAMGYLALIWRISLWIKVTGVTIFCGCVVYTAISLFNLWMNVSFTYGENPFETFYKDTNIEIVGESWEEFKGNVDSLEVYSAKGYDHNKDEECIVEYAWKNWESSIDYKIDFKVKYSSSDDVITYVYITRNKEMLKEK